MAAKYFVWGEGVWREVDVASGRVSGWRRRARFVFLRRGRLLVARRRPVLRALEALAAGQAGAAADGRRLAHRSKSESRARQRREPPAQPAARCEHHHCCAHSSASRANAKEYSNLEDHAIVAWVSAGARASLVGGNRVWRELQGQYPRLTGRERSWHSLRNRYLRYILPALGALHLPPADVSRLRAAASTGAIKRQNRASGPLAAPRHPMFKEPERGAASRRPRPPPTPRPARPASSGPDVASDDSDGPVAPRRRSLRARPLDSSSKDESSKESRSKVSGSKETSNKDESGKESASKASGSKEAASKASASKAPAKKTGNSREARSPSYSEVTRRFAARHRAVAAASTSASPVTSRSPSPVLTPARSRRLFNPNAHV